MNKLKKKEADNSQENNQKSQEQTQTLQYFNNCEPENNNLPFASPTNKNIFELDYSIKDMLCIPCTKKKGLIISQKIRELVLSEENMIKISVFKENFCLKDALIF